MKKITDTHAHYNDKAFDSDRDELIEKLLAEYCGNIIVIGWDIASSEAAIKLAEAHKGVYAAVGVHPENCREAPADYAAQIEKLAKHSKVRAIGETGLDYHYEGYDPELQMKFFKEQLFLARKLSLPSVIHSRDATEDTMKILRLIKPNAVMHCFSGSAETAREIVSLGLMISFTGVITFKNARKAVEAVKAVPTDHLMLETDCPYMAPEPFRGKRCDSSMLIYTAEVAAGIKGFATDTFIDICNGNAKRFFGLDDNSK